MKFQRLFTEENLQQGENRSFDSIMDDFLTSEVNWKMDSKFQGMITLDDLKFWARVQYSILRDKYESGLVTQPPQYEKKFIEANREDINIMLDHAYETKKEYNKSKKSQS